MRAAPSTMRAAILISRRRIVANSAVDSGERFGAASRIASKSQKGAGCRIKRNWLALGIAAGGAVRGELALVQLDEVLGVSARAIEGLVKMPGAGLERADDIAHVQPLGGCLDARHEAPLLVPASGAIAKGLEAAQLVFARERAARRSRRPSRASEHEEHRCRRSQKRSQRLGFPRTTPSPRRGRNGCRRAPGCGPWANACGCV